MEDYYDNTYDENEDLYDFSYDDNVRVVADGDSIDWRDGYDSCVSSSLVQVPTFIAPFIVANIVLCMISKVQVRFLPSFMFHLSNISCGLYLLYNSIDRGRWYLFQLLAPAYLLLKLSTKNSQRIRLDLVLCVFCIAYLIICEIYEQNAEVWHHIRGVLMIVVMKIISLALDSKSDGLVKSQINTLAFLGYICCPANCIFGPWTSFRDYMESQPKKNARLLSLTPTAKYIYQIAFNLTFAILCLLFSNCAQVFLISDYTWKWLAAYVVALSFRTSHYFVSFLSQATMVSAGYSTENRHGSKSTVSKHSRVFGYTVVLPWNIELPYSLIHVVVAWNVPMHNFLKQYVFRVLKPYGTFTAVFLTYVTSSLLHGLNFQLWATLLTLGIWSYVEYNIRKKLAHIFSACVAVGKCNGICAKHKLGRTAALSIVINFTFCCLSFIHLIYLGTIFDASSELQTEGFSFWHAVQKWQELHYLSHWILVLGLIFNWLI
ncbi:protein-serine O-palmitoleoyltransferase porcupine [Wyeomyia smithii]|uniref:protein-serine O-palmitoleoyltransferase porcupine n=1 Tax=Wyeomyia smithii TaxID=174621 RepID=UPI002467C7A0|nr:protein-serine O-palmitoleoyltransferase porcupine [Wyeomyia smithii]XP_055533127.1 protein-serine O-palmitoleoyltransferase porcupine [Wyeomyia smithii]XP_055541341.1 protein-serine O-palmitoleoyltransferase porcupine [Wyeomyia smithii]XP_055548789.1 protein-serine O-palmitoleoyltransferase porcupine [Wyeomyia smithii]